MSNPVYLALDLPTLDGAKALAGKVKAHIGGIKLGLEFFCAHGHHGVHEIAHLGLPIFLDLKLHDIPNTVAGAMQAIHVLEPAIVTVHASGGRAMMEDAKAAAGRDTKVVAVTLLTSLDERDLMRTGVNGNPRDQVMRLAELAELAGLDGIVCSGREVGQVHKQWKDGFFVVPGLRLNGGGHGDQKRVVTPRQARDDGASVLVVGRPISRAEDPEAAARAIEATLERLRPPARRVLCRGHRPGHRAHPVDRRRRRLLWAISRGVRPRRGAARAPVQPGELQMTTNVTVLYEPAPR